MTFTKRLGYYGFGFVLGIFLLVFFLNQKHAGCDYFPNARILKLIREKPLSYTDDAKFAMQNLKIDTLDIKQILVEGEIDFSKSKTRIKPCRFYWIEGITKEKTLVLYIKSCKNKAIIESLTLKEN